MPIGSKGLIDYLDCVCSWDRLVPESFILKANEANKVLMKRLTETAKKQ